LQAAIAAVHDEAATADQTDWPQILALYGLLERNTGNLMVMLDRAVEAAMVDGPAAGLRLLAGLDKRLPGHHRPDAVRAHLLELAGDPGAAIAFYQTAAGRTTSIAERHYLLTPRRAFDGQDPLTARQGAAQPRPSDHRRPAAPIARARRSTRRREN
jgi:predicted RNA polymerase sigma factor